MKASSYVRVSTADQSLAMQRNDIQTYCQAKGICLDREFADHGISGAKSSRPALDELMNEVRRRRVKMVVVWSLSRLGRSLKNLLHIVEEFQSCGVTLVSLREGWDLSTSSGRMIFQVLGALAEWEREQIRERVKGGLRAAKAKGKRLGRPSNPYSPEEISSLRAKGLSLRAISKKLGISRMTALRALSQIPPKKAAVNS